MHCQGKIKLLHLLVLVGIGIFLLALLIPMIYSTRVTSSNVTCAHHLRQIGQALLLYANENNGDYPRTRYTPGLEVIPGFGTGTFAKDPFGQDGASENDITSALFLLIRTQDISAEVFICPSTADERDSFGQSTALDRSNFTDIRLNLSYSVHNPYYNERAIAAGAKWNNKLGQNFALAADMNPGTAGEGDDVTAATSVNPKPGNSNNHEKDGQNVLYGDGHTAFAFTPLCGINDDNIYTSQSGKVVDSALDGDDSVLLPTDD